MALEQMMGSLSALSLASPVGAPLAIAGLVVGGAVITVAAAEFGHKKFEQYEEKKHRAEMEIINSFHRKFLTKITVKDYGDINPLPAIFKFSGDKDHPQVDSLHYTTDEVIATGNTLPHGTDVALSTYRELVRSAILKIKEYYFTREDHHDITAGVLSYLLNILENKCLNFAGYDFDIAYLDAICKFIDAYSSKDGREETQHFSRLTPAYTYLKEARRVLLEHKNALSMEELVAELRDNCAAESNKLLRFLVKMTTPKANKEIEEKTKLTLADTVSLYELKEGILRRKYIKGEIIKGNFKWYYDQLSIPATPYKQWVVRLSDYYLKSLSTVTTLKDSSVVPPNEMFAFTDWAIQVFSQYNSKDKKSDEYKLLIKSLDSIKEVFKKSPNFLNTKLVTEHDLQKFVPVTEYNEIIDRSKLISDYSTLIHSVISLQYLSNHLLKSIKQLGELYVQDPSHFRRIFFVLENLCQIVNKNIEIVTKEFDQILTKNKDTMSLDTKELFPLEVNEVLESIQAIVKKYSDKIRDYRINSRKTKDTAEAAKYDMLEAANMIANLYSMPTKTDPNNKIPCPSDVEPLPKEEPTPEKNKPTIDIDEIDDALYNLTERIHNRVFMIQKEQPNNPHIKQYYSIYNTLNVMQTKSIDLINEKNKDLDRMDKAKQTAELTISLCQQTLDFLSLTSEERTIQGKSFTQSIHKQLTDASNSGFIDRHHHAISQFLYEHLWHWGIFSTDTRKKLTDFDKAIAFVSSSQ